MVIDPRDMEYPCFFCDKREATHLFSLKGGWGDRFPELRRGQLARCDQCAKLPPEALAAHILEYVRHLRIGANRRKGREPGVN